MTKKKKLSTFRSFVEVQEALAKNNTTCLDITNIFLAKIEEYKHLNAFVEVYKDEALKQSLIIDNIECNEMTKIE